MKIFASIVAAAMCAALFGSSASCAQTPHFTPHFVVLPRLARVFAGNALQFYSSLSGVEDIRIRWSVIGPGSIDGSGLYHAPKTRGVADVVGDAGAGVTDAVSVSTVDPPRPDHSLLLSTCYQDGTLDVFTKRPVALTGGFSVGGRAAGIAVDMTHERAAFAVDTQIVSVALKTMRWIRSQPVAGARFSEVAFVAGGYLVATDNDAEPTGAGVRVFSFDRTGRPALVSSIPAGETPEGITTADNGRTVYVTAMNTNQVFRFAVTAGGHLHQTGVAQTAARPFGVAVDTRHQLLFVADNDTATLNGSRARPGLERFQLPGMHRIGDIMSMGSRAALPLGVAIDPELSRLFVTNEGLANVAVFALPSMHRVATLHTGLTPWLPALDAREHRLYVPAARADTIWIFDTRKLAFVDYARTCSYPTAVAIADRVQ